MTQPELQKLRDKQPPKWAAKISKELGITQDQIRKVIRGESYNPAVIASAVRLASQEKKSNQKLKEEIAAL